MSAARIINGYKISTYDVVSDHGLHTEKYLGYYTIEFFGYLLHFVDTIPKNYVTSLVDDYKRHVSNHLITVENAKYQIKKIVENVYFYSSSLIKEDDIVFKRQSITKHYDHSRPINLVKQDKINQMSSNEFFSQNKRIYQKDLWK